METFSTIDIARNCAEWSRLCPDAERLAEEAAGLALVDGFAAAGVVPPGRLELGITLGGAAEQQRLNREYRGQDRPTNVLAFPAWQPGTRLPSDAPVLLGDVVLAFETVAREAAEQEKSLADHLCHLIVHGVLHLLGFDHLTAADAITMKALEKSILAKLGVSDPYRDCVASLEGGPVRDACLS